MDVNRYSELKKMLGERQRDLVNEVQGRLRDVFAKDGVEAQVSDASENIGHLIALMKQETLNKLDAALGRLEEGRYGNCFECGKEISLFRLRALPFSVRCKDCEDIREKNLEKEKRSHI